MIQPSSISEQLLFSTVRIETEMEFGTGFFFLFNLSNEVIVPFIVTNKHLVENREVGRLIFHEEINRDGIDIVGDESIIVNFDDFEKGWINHPDPKVDLCAIELNPIKNMAFQKIGKKIYVKCIDESLIWSDEKLHELSAIEEIVMIGYPNGLWDNINNFPVVRRGITASHPGIKFQGRNDTLVDIACFEGSSGSPVLILNIGSYTDKFGNLTLGSDRVIFLGILYEGPRLNSKQMLHLGYIVKAGEMLVLKEHLKKHFNLE